MCVEYMGVGNARSLELFCFPQVYRQFTKVCVCVWVGGWVGACVICVMVCVGVGLLYVDDGAWGGYV